MKKTRLALLFCLATTLLFAQSSSLHFDGSNDYIAVAENTAVLTGNSLTCEVWVKPTSLSSTSVIINKGNNGNYFLLSLYKPPLPANAVPRVQVFLSDGYGNAEFFYNISTAWLNEWHHLAVTYDGDLITLYIDGMAVSSYEWSQSIPENVGYLRIGASYSGSPCFNGYLDELRIWNLPRTESEIQASMNTEIDPATLGLTAYYRFNEGTPGGNNTAITTALDQVGSAGNGTLTNFARTGSTSNYATGQVSLLALPLHKDYFTASTTGDAVRLSWKDLENEQAPVYKIERSTDGQNFEEIGTVQGIRGREEHSYTFTDHHPSTFINYYRLRSVEQNGQVSYSKTIVVRMHGSRPALQIYPNPARHTLNMQLKAPNGPVQVQIREIGGKLVKTMELFSDGSSLSAPVDISQLSRGRYLITTNGQSAFFLKE